jgi:hypothetical protein
VLLALLVADVLVGLEPTPSDPLTLAGGATVIGLVGTLAFLLVRVTSKRGDGWESLMDAQRKALADEGARADRAEARVGERDTEINRLHSEMNDVHRNHRQAEAAARYAVDARERAEQALSECEDQLRRGDGGRGHG